MSAPITERIHDADEPSSTDAPARSTSRRRVGTGPRGIVTAVRRSSNVRIGLLIVTALFMAGLLAPFLTPYSPLEIDLAQTLQPPSAEHWLGTDELGRDQMTRLLFGARVSLVMGLLGVTIAASVGASLGLIAGYAGGFADSLIMRAMDAIFAFPALLLALLVISITGPGITQVLIAFGIAGIPFYARLMRGMVLAIRQQEYVIAAEALGGSPVRVIMLHILPNAITPLIITTTMAMGLVIVGLASLGFLGLGAQPPTPEWGAMLSGSQSRFFTAPWLLLSPGIAIVLAVVGYALIGDGLRDFLDPRLREYR